MGCVIVASYAIVIDVGVTGLARRRREHFDVCDSRCVSLKAGKEDIGHTICAKL